MLARLWTIWSRRQAIVALLLPVVGLLGFSGYIVAEKIELLRASGNLREEMALTQALTGLVHELQRERGQAALFLGSQGGLSRQNLEEQFAATDRQHQLFQRRSIAYRNSSGHWPLLPRLQHAEAVTATLPAQRNAVRAGDVSWQEILDSYSTRIAAVLELGSGVAEANGRVRLLAAWAHLAQAKEAIGQERAVGAAALARGVFDWSSLATLNRLEATQDAFIRMFRRNINAETGRFFDLVLTQPALREASELRDQLMAAAAAGRLAPIPPSRWYDALTRKIDNLRIVEERLAADAEQMVQQNVRQAASTVIWTCVVVVVLLMVSWTTLRRSERRAARAGERLVNAIENIPEGFALWGGDGALVLSNSRYEVLDRETRQSLPHSLGSSQREHRLEDGRWLLARTTTLANGERVEIYSDITEDKQRGLAVEASEARLRSILENIGEGIITIDHGGIIRSFNRAAQDIFGHDATDVIGRPVSTVTGDLFDGGDGAAGADPLSASGALPTAACYEGKVPRADGRLLTVEAAITELSLPDETLSVGIFRDITERRRAEEQLRKLHRAVEQSPISIIITDTTGRIEYANAAFRGTTGYSGEEVLGHTMGDLKSGCNPTAVYKELWATIEAGQEWRGELCNKTKRGDLIWERVTISPVASPNGVIENYIGLRENVTELKRVQRALHIEHENTLRILSSMNDGICVIDTEFQVRYVNDAMRSAFGSPEGRHCHDYLYGECQPCPRCSMCSVQPEQGRHEWQAERTGKTYEVAETAVDGMDGARLKLCVFHDITVRKQAEEAMAKARASAEAANRAKTEFLAAMSHELRTPLNAIIGFSEIIADQVLGPVERRYADYAQDIRSSGRHLLALINDILDVAAIEIGRIVLQEAAVDVAAAVDGAVTMLRERAERSGIAMTIRAAPDLPLLLADERRIRQVLLNLVSNAVKFTPAGGRVEVQVGLSAAGDMVVRVTDTGIGIASEDIPKALAFFSQVDSSLARRYEGSGLGLPLTKGLVELHGGTLDLASEVGVGTAVTVTFPKRRVIAAATSLTDWSI